jgi:uncharacterized protein
MLNSDRQIQFQAIELYAVGLSVLLKFIMMDWLGMRAFYITGTCLFWLGYVFYRYRKDNSILKLWGFKREYLLKSLYALLPFLGIIAVFSLLYGLYSGTRILNIHILPVLLLYPAWGIIQQFMLACIIARNLQFSAYFSRHTIQLIILVSLLFSVIHYPYLKLMGFALLMEIIFLFVYDRWRNLWALGLMHGWAATLVLFYFLHRDLWAELFAWF